MENPPPIHLLPNELLVKIIEKLPRTQWPALELVDRKFRDAVLLAWGSVREVDMELDFIYSTTKEIEDENEHDSEMIEDGLRRQTAQKTKSILKKLSERSPFITSLVGSSWISDDLDHSTTAVHYLSKFKHLETIKFVSKYCSIQIVNGIRFIHSLQLSKLVEFMESTQSRATLKEINIEQCYIPDDPSMLANFDQRLRAAFANDSNDPMRQLLRLESFSMRIIDRGYPLTIYENMNASKLTELSLGSSAIEPTTLTMLINAAPQLRHLDFAFLERCRVYDNASVCPVGHLQPNKDLLAAVESHPNLTSLGFNKIWHWNGRENVCACHQFEAEFKKMLRTIAPQLVHFCFLPGYLPRNLRMREIRDMIQNHMPQLKSIKLDECYSADPEDLRGIADGKELEQIEIASSAQHNNYVWSLNEVLSTILSKSPQLKRFNGLNFTPTQRVAVELSKLSDLVDLRICPKRLTKKTFVMLSQQIFTEKLQVLHLGSIGPGVEIGLIELIKKATQLRELDVHMWQNETVRLLECVAESCPKLKKFNARRGSGITFDGVQMLVDRCRNLRWLYVENMDRNLASSLKDLKLDRYRKLEFY